MSAPIRSAAAWILSTYPRPVSPRLSPYSSVSASPYPLNARSGERRSWAAE